MKNFSTIILRIAVFVFVAIMLAICIGVTWNVFDSTPAPQRYPFTPYVILVGIYATAVPFVIALYQILKLLGYIDRHTFFSEMSIKALTLITRFFGVITTVCAVIGLPVFYIAADLDDAPGLVIIGMILTGLAFVTAVFASVLRQLVREGMSLRTKQEDANKTV